MTGRDLIMYILANKLEDEPIYKDGMLVGLITADDAATKLGVGVATIHAWIELGLMDYVLIGNQYFVTADCEVKTIERK